jgi:hypothetical protein
VVEGLRRGVARGAGRLAHALDGQRGQRYDGNGTCARSEAAGHPSDPSPAIARP